MIINIKCCLVYNIVLPPCLTPSHILPASILTILQLLDRGSIATQSEELQPGLAGRNHALNSTLTACHFSRLFLQHLIWNHLKGFLVSDSLLECCQCRDYEFTLITTCHEQPFSPPRFSCFTLFHVRSYEVHKAKFC